MTTEPSTQTRELKPCPFCGSSAFTSWDGDTNSPEDWSANCDNALDCGACVQGMNSEDAAVNAWDTRTPSDTEQRLREALVLCAIPYEALLIDAESRRWIAPEVWAAIETAATAARAALQPQAEQEQS